MGGMVTGLYPLFLLSAGGCSAGSPTSLLCQLLPSVCSFFTVCLFPWLWPPPAAWGVPSPSPKHSVLSSNLGCPQTTWIPSPALNCSLTPDVPRSPCSAELPWCFLCDTSQTVAAHYKVEPSFFDLSHSYASCETQPRHHLLWEALQG